MYIYVYIYMYILYVFVCFRKVRKATITKIDVNVGNVTT